MGPRVNGKGFPLAALLTMCLAGAALFMGACGAAYRSTYPSYDRVVSQYLPPGEYESVRLDGSPERCVDTVCSCPRLMYHGHWVYHCGGHWVYWDDGCWYHYPHFYVYYWGGGYHVYTSSDLRITKGAGDSAGDSKPVHYGAPPSKSSSTRPGSSMSPASGGGRTDLHGKSAGASSPSRSGSSRSKRSSGGGRK